MVIEKGYLFTAVAMLYSISIISKLVCLLTCWKISNILFEETERGTFILITGKLYLIVYCRPDAGSILELIVLFMEFIQIFWILKYKMDKN